jgi:hypothetical protein
MPAPGYFRPKPKQTSLSKITGGLSPVEIRSAIESGARFIVFQYVISAILISSRRNSRIIYLKPSENPTKRGLPYTLLTALAGWWGIPHGIINTPTVIYQNFRGGKDITANVLATIERFPTQTDIVFKS